MGTTYLDRRQVLKGLGAGALAAGATATLSPVAAIADEDESSPLGGWNINVHPTGGISRRAAAGFAAGGVFTTADSLAAGAVGVGSWRRLEGNKFALKFTVFDFSHGGAVPVVVSGRGSVTGNSMSGTFSASVFGNPAGGGTIDGTRIIA